MNRTTQSYRIISNWATILLLLVTLIPLFGLSFYNHPSPADDYCYIYTVKVHGWLGGMYKYYDEWTGRYFAIILQHSNPLIFGWFWAFKVLPVLLIIAFVVSIYMLARQVTPTLSRQAHLGFVGVIFFLYVLKMGSAAEAFFWLASYVVYTVPTILTIIWAISCLRWYRSESRQSRIWLGILINFLTFAIVGSGETSLLGLLVLIASWFFYRAVFLRKIDPLMISVVIVATVSCLGVFLSPGNAARLSGNPQSGDLLGSLLATLKFLALSVFQWLLKTPVLLFTIGWVLALFRRVPLSLTYFKLPFWYVFLTFLALLSSQVFPFFYSTSHHIGVPERLVNVTYFFFLLGWFYCAGVGVVAVRSRSVNIPFSKAKVYGPLIVLLGLSCVYFFLRSQNFNMIYSDLFQGKAEHFDRQMMERYAIIKNSPHDIVYVPLISDPPKSLFTEDLRSDPKAFWNWCLAGYFGKKEIRIESN